MDAVINGLPYVLALEKQFEWGYAQSLAEPFRTTAIPTLQDNILLSRFQYKWHNGLGFSRQHRESGDGVSGVADADLDTFNTRLTLPHLAQSITLPAAFSATGPTVVPQAWVNFKENFYLLCHEVSASSGAQGVGIAAFSGSGDNYGSATTIQAGANDTRTLEAADVVEHKGKLYALYTIETADVGDLAYDIESSPDASTWSDASGAGFPSTTLYRVNNGDVVPAESGGYPFGLLLDAPQSGRHDLIAAIREESAASGGSNDQTRIYDTANEGTGWTNTGNISGKPRGRAMWGDPFTAGHPLVPYISTTANIYLIDPANSDAIPLLEAGTLGGQDDDGFMEAGHDGALYVATSGGDILRLVLPGDIGRPIVVNIGPITHVPLGGDGLVAARRGPVSWMTSTPQALYVCFKGASNAHILRFRYSDHTWHSFNLAANTNRIYRMAASSADDGTRRIHVMVDNGSTVGLLAFEKHDDSLAQVTAPTETDGYINFPSDDFGDANNDSGAFEAVIDGQNLSATESGEYIEFYSDDQDGDWGDTDRGSFLSGDKDLSYASGVGISVRTMKNRLVFHRDAGTNTDTPVVDEFEVRVVTSQAVLRRPVLPIDLVKTMERYDRFVETQISDLETIFKTATQVTVKLGKTSEFHAIVKDPPQFQLTVKGADDQMDEGRLEGIAFVPFTQLLEGV